MAHFIDIKADGLNAIRSINPRLMSYNVEMTDRKSTRLNSSH